MGRLKDWRLILTGPKTGPENMAIDEALLLEYEASSDPIPVLRFYGWEPAFFSLGRHQNPEEVLNLETCEKNGISYVRRMTGGGAILHKDEITYSLVCSDEDIHSSKIKESYKILCSFLISTYQALGLKAAFAQDYFTENKPALGVKTQFCFAGKEHYDILVNGKKLGGNAQRRKRNVILQHGSIPVQLHLELANQCLLNPIQGEKESIVSLSSLGLDNQLNQIPQLMQECFVREMKVKLNLSELSIAENKYFKNLLMNKYKNPQWNRDGKEPDSGIKED